MTGVRAAAEEVKPISYKLKKGELDAPDPTPQRSEGQGSGEPEGESDEEDNGGRAISEESLEAGQDHEGAGREAAQKETGMQVHGLPTLAVLLARCMHTLRHLEFRGQDARVSQALGCATSNAQT